jgi:uncharacterized protein (DUF58 family)
MPDAPLLDRAFLEKLERLTIQWQRSFAGLVGGHNASRFAGGGQEFLDHRNFHHGDDLRAVNWRAYLRLDKLFLKMFQIEPRVPVQILVDVSKSMAVEERTLRTRAKFDYARRLAGALAYVGLVRLDTLAIMPFSSRLGEGKRVGGGRHRFSPVMDYLTALEPAGVTDFHEVVREFMRAQPQRGLLVILSDFLDDRPGDRGCERALQYLADFGHELCLVQIWNEEDRTPPWTGELELTDAETGQQLRTALDAQTRIAYTHAFDEYSASLQQLALRNGGRFLSVPTSKDLEEVLFTDLVRARGVA